MRMIHRKPCVYGMFLIIILSSLIIPVAAQGGVTWWDKNWSFRQELSLPISTQNVSAQYQPIDIRVIFQNPCWTLSENQSSVRVCCWNGSLWSVLESQIYDLNYTDTSHIKGCSLVFLVPGFANGKEQYYLYYTDKETAPTGYPDHVQVEKTHYYYEPLPGQKADFDYYKITDSGFCVYGVGIQGMMLTEYGSNMIFRQSKGQKDFSYRYWDRLASFCFQYRDASLPVGQDTITTRMKLLTDEIFVDGNLMVEFGIVSTTSRDDVKTTDIYKYYYSPINLKRLCVHVTHEVLKDINVASVEKVDGEYAFTTGFKTQSEANTFLNTGEILPYIHYYNFDDTVKQVKADTSPQSKEQEWLISVEDNADLGHYPWVSADSGENGKAHALIFASNKVVKAGTNEQDGIQIKADQKQEVDIPGLQAYSSGMGCFRNAYNTSGSLDLAIPSDLVVDFNAEFYTTEINSYRDVENEAPLYQQLAAFRPSLNGSVSGGAPEGKHYNLTVVTHFARSFPLGSLISAASGKNFSYTYAELYRNGALVSSGICSRISLAGGLNIDLKNISLRSILKLFNWKDLTLFKKIQIPDLATGTYVVKIYIKSGQTSKYVGVKPVEIQKDTRVDVACSKQQKLTVHVTDQNKQSVSACRCILSLGNASIGENVTDANGGGVLLVPRGTYDLKLMYQGFTLFEQPVRLGLLQKTEQFHVSLYDLQVIVKDKFGLPPGTAITPVATSKDMEQPTKIVPTEIDPGAYRFTNLPEATYTIQISYKTFLDEITVRVPDVGDSASMEFSPMFELTTTVYDSRGSTLSNMPVEITRSGISVKNTTDAKGVTSFFIPVGDYVVQASSNGMNRATKDVEVLRDETTDLVTTLEPLYTLIVMIVASLCIVVGAVLLVVKKGTLPSFLKLCGVALCLVAVVMPWWALSGSATTPSANRTTNAYLTTQTIVTQTTVGASTQLELANIPQEFSLFLLAVLLLVILAACIIVGSIVLQNHRKPALVLTVLGVVFLICGVAIFTYGFSQLSSVGLGSLQGSGTVTVPEPQGTASVNLSATWGLSTGAYLTIVAVVFIVVAVVLERRAKKKKTDTMQ